MSQTSAQNRERAVKAITQRNMLQRRIKRAQRQLEAAQGEARQSLQNSIAADQAEVAELTPTLEQIKADMRREEESIRRKTEEALRCLEELRRSQSPYFQGNSVPPRPGQAFALLVVLGAMVSMISAMLLLNR